MDRILFPRANFDHLRSCPIDQLEEDIARTSICLKLQGDLDREHYKAELDRLSVVKYISQLRKGKPSYDDFMQKVQLTA